MRSVTHTRYILALSAGEVPGEVRSAYLEDMKEVERGAPLLGVILSTTTKAVLDKQMTAADARRLVQEEYAAWELEKTLGDYALGGRVLRAPGGQGRPAGALQAYHGCGEGRGPYREGRRLFGRGEYPVRCVDGLAGHRIRPGGHRLRRQRR